ncbi:membrane integrity-associated transporter subunit PqiC [Escherichia coli]|nr:membrane integrity-associated transporter subunit PqiC [Escherichia coli]
MKKWLVTIAALWLAGCSSGEINKNYYQLPVVQSGTQSTASQGNRLLWVEQVAVPDYLAGNGVVYQTSDVKYVIANNNLWASPLDQQLRNTLGSAQDTLNVTVTEFNGRYDGKVIVSGEWLLNHQGQLIKRPFRLEGVQTQDGYDEMVKVLASVWSQEAASIAQEIKRLP